MTYHIVELIHSESVWSNDTVIDSRHQIQSKFSKEKDKFSNVHLK